MRWLLSKNSNELLAVRCMQKPGSVALVKSGPRLLRPSMDQERWATSMDVPHTTHFVLPRLSRLLVRRLGEERMLGAKGKRPSGAE